MASVVEVWNLALSHIGAQAEIASETENSNEAAAARLSYPAARDLTLRAFPWNFAKKVGALADMGTPFDSWGFRYRYPTDCMFARYIVNGAGRNQPPIPFEIAWDEADGRVILSDESGASLAYTAQVTSVGAWEDQFIDALSWLLASRLAYAITRSAKIRTETLQIYQQTIRAAWASGLNEGEPDVALDAASIRARV